MKLLILNLPYKRPIIRRFSTSYNASGFLYPPVELLRVATIIKENSKNLGIEFIDAIAEKISKKSLLKKIFAVKPDLILTLAAVDHINPDYLLIREIKEKTGLPFIVIGYIPDLYREDYRLFDTILGNNFENAIYQTCRKGASDVGSFLKELRVQASVPGNFNPDLIAKTDLSFIKPKFYSEIFNRGKTAFTYFSFGCPFHCNYCIRTYGLTRNYYRKKELIFDELEDLFKQGYKNIRILDDNCTLKKPFLKELLGFINEKKIRFNFIGLSRIDLIDEETIHLLAKLGFKKLYIGIESFSEKNQKAYDKNLIINENELFFKFKLLNKNNITPGVWILFNPLTETFDDLKCTLKNLRRFKIRFASISILTAYPGTKFFKDHYNNLKFSPRPFHSEIIGNNTVNVNKIENRFLFSFYLLNGFNSIYSLLQFLLYPAQTIRILKSLVSYVFSGDRERKDFI